MSELIYPPALAVEPDPAVPVGCACGECGRPYGVSHLGTCSLSLMASTGCGIVGFRVAARGTAPVAVDGPQPPSEIALLRGDVVAIRDELRWLRWYIPAPRFGPRRKAREGILRNGFEYLEQVTRDISGRLDRLTAREPADG